MTVPMMPIVGAKPPAFVNVADADVVARDHAVDLGFEDVAHEVWVDSVDHELQALAGELVVDLVDPLVKREQALTAGLLGQRHQ